MIEANRGEFTKANIIKWHEAGYKGQGVTILVLDSKGIPYPFTKAESPFPSWDEGVGHKSYVCAVIREVAPEARIIAINHYGNKETLFPWVIDHQEEIDLINCSFGARESEWLPLKDTNISFFKASGNDTRIENNNMDSFASADWTISVGAWYEGSDIKAHYSEGGENLDIVSYTNIEIPTSKGLPSTMQFTGTSCATPFATGLAALYLSYAKQKNKRKLTRQEIRDFVITNTIDKMEDGKDYWSGHGLFILPAEIPTIEQAETPHIEESDEMVFKDTGTHWARQEIDFISEQKIMNGFPDGTFQPDKVMTRAEVATVIARMLGFVKK